jgi:hypothetical protein
MKVPSRKAMTADDRYFHDMVRSLQVSIRNFHRQEDIRQAQEAIQQAEEQAREAQLRTRRAIERQCRKRYFRDKYSAIGLWPLPPEGTSLGI